MAPRRSWILAPRAPNFDCTPGGYLSLGSIIADPFEPESPLIPGVPPALPATIPVDHVEKSDWERALKKSHKGRLGIWAQFLQFIGFTVEAGTDWDNSQVEAYKFDRLDIDGFVPPKPWLEERMKVPEIVNYIAQGILRKSVYVIVGVMTARGSSVTRDKDNNWGIILKLGGDLAAAGAPGVSVGPDIGFSYARTDHITFRGSSDFVFAYRLREVYYKKTVIHTGQYYSRGAAMSEQDRAQNEAGAAPQFSVDEVRLSESDVSAEQLELEAGVEQADDELSDGEESECILPE